jgi:hypothetical protein
MLTVKAKSSRIQRWGCEQSLNHDECGDDKACLWIRRLLSGLPSDQRARRYLIVLQAWIDDSGRGKESDSPVFVLAGYAGPVQSFYSFSDDWQAIMRQAPALPYLKGKEANALVGHFKGWTAEQRDAKLENLIAVIRKHDLIAVSVAINFRDFNRILAEPKGVLKNPYGVAFAYMVGWLMHSANVKPEREEIELIFDQGTLAREKEIEDAYKGMKGAIPKEAMDLLVGRPRFEDDKRHLPLQAADLFAWNVRRDLVEQLKTGKTWESRTWTALRTGIRGKPMYLGEKDLHDFKTRYLAARQERLARAGK